MSSRFSESRDLKYVGSAMCPECPGKIGEANPAGYTHGKNDPDVVQGLEPRNRWNYYISDHAWLRLDVEPDELSDISVDRKVFGVFLGMLLPQPRQRKSGYENDQMNDDAVNSLQFTVF